MNLRASLFRVTYAREREKENKVLHRLINTKIVIVVVVETKSHI